MAILSIVSSRSVVFSLKFGNLYALALRFCVLVVGAYIMGQIRTVFSCLVNNLPFGFLARGVNGVIGLEPWRMFFQE